MRRRSVSRETRRDVAVVLGAFVGCLVAIAGAWFAVGALLTAVVAAPALIPELVVAALVAVDVTSPRPRLVKINREGQ